MSNINSIDQVLTEMRRIAAAAQAEPVQPDKVQGAGGNFADLLKQSIDQVNDLQKTAGQLSTAFSAGDPNVDVAQVMVALQKSGIAFQAMSQIRNRLVSAYQEIMSMQV